MDTKLHLKPPRGNNLESMKARVVILVCAYRHDMFYITVKYHDYIPKGIQVTERTQICIKKHQRADNSKSIKVRLSLLYATHRHDLFYITVKYHQNIPNGTQVIERTRKCLRTDGRQAPRYIP